MSARKKTRLTQEQRSAATREKLIASAIDCLHDYGYAASTTNLISDRAGVSRGAMQHQFGTRVDLMIAVAEAIYAEQEQVKSGIERYRGGREAFVGMTDVTWEAMNKPSAVALLEITLAGRSDEDLAARHEALFEANGGANYDRAWRLAEAAGITDRPTVQAMAQLHVATMNGLSLMTMLGQRTPELAQACLMVLRWYKGLVTERLLAPPGQVDEAVAAYVASHAIAGTIPQIIDHEARAEAVASSLAAIAEDGRRERKVTRDPRGEETRARALEAAVTCLGRYGYAATTTMLVADEAGISRGAMQQQFRTRHDLMIAVIDAFVRQQDAFYGAQLERYPPGEARFLAVIDIIRQAYASPMGQAVTELLLACRSDPALRERHEEVSAQFAYVDDRTWRMAQEIGITDRAVFDAVRVLNRAALRGLSIDQMLSSHPRAAEPALDLLRWYMRIITRHLIEAGKA